MPNPWRTRCGTLPAVTCWAAARFESARARTPPAEEGAPAVRLRADKLSPFTSRTRHCGAGQCNDGPVGLHQVARRGLPYVFRREAGVLFEQLVHGVGRTPQ